MSHTETGWSVVIANISKEEIVEGFLSLEVKLNDATLRSEPKFEVGKGSFTKSFKSGGFNKPAVEPGEKMKPIAPRAQGGGPP
jgi:hypothetical protein